MIGNRENLAKKLIGGSIKSKVKQIGSRGIRAAISAAVKGPDMSERGISNNHNNEDVQKEPKFEHTRPEKSSGSSLEK